MLAVLLASPAMAQRIEPVAVSTSNTVLTIDSFLKIKAVIMNTGDRVTYCNMYNHNPHYGFKTLDAFLNPDTGQANINCETNKSDFNEMVLRTKDTPFRYVSIRLKMTSSGERTVELLHGAKEDDATKMVSLALSELQQEEQ